MKQKHENLCCSNTANGEDCSRSKGTATALCGRAFNKDCSAERSMMGFDHLVFSNCPYSSRQPRLKRHSRPLDPRLFPYRKWLLLAPFHQLPISFQKNPLPLQALGAATAKPCSKPVRRTRLHGGRQLLTAPAPAAWHSQRALQGPQPTPLPKPPGPVSLITVVSCVCGKNIKTSE